MKALFFSLIFVSVCFAQTIKPMPEAPLIITLTGGRVVGCYQLYMNQGAQVKSYRCYGKDDADKNTYHTYYEHEVKAWGRNPAYVPDKPNRVYERGATIPSK